MSDLETTASRVTRHIQLSQKYLSVDAQEAFKNNATSSVVSKENGSIFRCAYFSVVSRQGNEEEGVKILADIANDLAEQGLIHSVLAPISSLPLVRMPLQVDRSAVFMFLLIPHDKHQEVAEKYKNIYMLEGGVGKDVGDLNPILEDGEFLADIRATRSLMIKDEKIARERIQDQIDQYLAVLPRGTVVREVTECSIIDLTYPFEVKFYNPLFDKVKSVSLEYTRQFARVDNKIEQFNLLLEVRYFDADQNQLFKNPF